MTWEQAIRRACDLAQRWSRYGARFRVESYVDGSGERVYEVRCAGPGVGQGCAL